MELHRSYCAKFGVTLEDLESTEAAPATLAYTNHLLRVAYAGDLADILAALLPCAYGYYEHGRDLARAGEPVNAPLYVEWIRMYSSPEYGEIADWLRGDFDELAASLPDRRKAELEDHYRISARYEYLFWDMAYKMEQWSV
jgi:thiaminase/transcriptional activator TenA